jgi:hypothetical protein
MSNEDFDRHMAFMLEQQARFDANLAKQQERDAEAWAKQQEYNAQVKARLDKTDRQIAELAGFTGILRDALLGLTHHAERHDREMADLVAMGKETDARLNALMLVVERHLSSHQ